MLYPINLEIKDMKITIIGGGDVAYRKCKNFLEFGKSVRVISPEFIDSFELIKNNVELVYDVYKEEYIKDSFIVVAATNNKEINKNIGIYCRSCGKLVNVVDDIKLSNYTVPSYVKRGDLLISISTGGKSPSLSSEIKKELEANQNLDYQYIILDVPLLFESKLDKLCDYTIGVIAPKTEKIKRICKRDKLSKEKALQRLNSQPNDEFFTKNCNTVINNENKEETIKMMNEIMLKLQ